MTGRDGVGGGTTLLGWSGVDGLPGEPAPRVNRFARWTARAVAAVAVLAAVQVTLASLTVLTARQVALLASSSGLRLRATELPQIVELTKDGGRNPVYLDELPLALRALAAAPGFLEAATLLAAGVLVVGLVRAVARGGGYWVPALPLVSRLGVVLVVGGLVIGLVDALAVRRSASAVFELEGVLSVDGFATGRPGWPWWMIVAGVVVLVLRRVFREGARLQDEVDSVV